MRRARASGPGRARRRAASCSRLVALLLTVAACGGAPAAAQTVASSAKPVASSPRSPAPVAPRPAAPKPGESFDAWCARLRTAEPFVPFRCTREDDWTEPGHPSRTQRARWAGSDVARAFEHARALFGVPASVVPPRSGPREQTIEDPGKSAEVWESTLTVRRGADGTVREARWFERREGSGRTVVARRVDARFVEVSEAAFAD
jgi:hypothetical protein